MQFVQKLEHAKQRVEHSYVTNKHLLRETGKFAGVGAFIGMALTGIGSDAFGMHGASVEDTVVYITTGAVIGATAIGVAVFKELQRKERTEGKK